MTDSGVIDSMNSTESRFCSAQQPDHCRKGDNIKIFCLKDKRWKRIRLTNNRMKRYDRIGKWHNYCAINPLPGEKRLGSVDLTPGTRWVIYYPEETLGNTNPFEEDENPEIDEHDTTPVVELAEMWWTMAMMTRMILMQT